MRNNTCTSQLDIPGIHTANPPSRSKHLSHVHCAARSNAPNPQSRRNLAHPHHHTHPTAKMPTLKLKLSRHKHRKPIYRPPTPDPRKPYHAPSLYARVLAKLLSKNQIRELQEAQRLFELRADPGAAAACASMCYEIVDERPSEAVAARAHGMLAVKGVGGLADARR